MKKLLLLSILIITLTDLKAQLLSGGEIYYELIGTKLYKVTAHVYRQCDSDPLLGLSGFVIADTLKETINFTRTGIQKINDTCGNPCNKQNEWSNPGFEKHSFQAVIDFSNSTYKKFVDSGKCFVHFAVRQGGRDSRTTTHDPGMFYLDAGVDICATGIIKNHSPIFSMEPKFLAPCNISMSYSPGPLDTADHDSLVFSLEPVQTNYMEDIGYAPGYSAQIPLTPYCPPTPGLTTCRDLPNSKPPRGFHFDPNLCQMVTTPTKCDEYGYLRFKIKEYRRINNQVVLLGFTCREMLVTPRSSPGNNTPTLVIEDNAIAISLCSSNKYLNLSTIDPVASPAQTDVDTTHIYWDGGYYDHNLTIYDSLREKSATFELQYNSDLVGKKQYFTVAYNDRTCNLWTNTRTFSVVNLPQLEFNKTTSLDSCNVFSYTVKTKDNQNFLNTNASIMDASNKFISSIGNGASYTFNNNGRHYIRYTIQALSGICQAIVWDTLDINNSLPLPVFNINQDTAVCQSYPATLTFNPSKLPALKSINWYLNNALILTGDSSFSTSIDQIHNFKIVIEDQRNCLATKLIRFSIKSVNVNMLPDNTGNLCFDDQSYLVPNLGFTMKKPVTYKWTAYGVTTTQTTDSFRFQVKGNDKFRLWMKDVNHCIEEDSIAINTFNLISFNIVNNKNKNCVDSQGMFIVSQLNTSPFKTHWIYSGYDTSSFFSFIYRPQIKGNSYIKLRVTDNNLCSISDSIQVQAIPNPNITLISPDGICPGNSGLIRAEILNKTNQSEFKWYLNNVELNTTDSFVSFNGPLTGNFRLRAGNESACFSEQEKQITVYPKPATLKIATDTFYNPLHHITLTADPGFKTYLWFNGNNNQVNNFWAYELGAPGKYTVWCKVTDNNGCEAGDTMDIFTDRKLSVDKLRSEKGWIHLYPNPAQREISIETSSNSDYTVLSPDGKTVLRGQLNIGYNNLLIEHLCAGIYILKVGDNSLTFIKE